MATVFLQLGFRPFFLAMAGWAVAAMALFTLGAHGDIQINSHLGLYGWHAHEMVFGFVGAAVAGFLLTAVPAWTGGRPLVGLALLALVALWLAGRIAMLWSASAGPWLAAVIDAAFWAGLLTIVSVEIAKYRNMRNVPVVLALALIFVSVIGSHLFWMGVFSTNWPLKLGIGAIVLLISLIGGRIVPNFTRNWLVQRGAARLPAPFGHFDRMLLLASLVMVAGWVSGARGDGFGVAACLVGAGHLVRLARWRPLATLAEPLVWVMHLGYAWIGAGFLLLGLAELTFLLAETGAVHAWTAGAMGTMILAVATRATLGHTGRPLTAGFGSGAIFGLVSVAAGARLGGALFPDHFIALIAAAGTAWIAAFALYLGLYGPALVGPRVDGSAPETSR